MEPTKGTLRAILPLGKYRVTDITGNDVKIWLGGTTTLTITLTNVEQFDLREGDLLTFYTEVPFKEPH